MPINPQDPNSYAELMRQLDAGIQQGSKPTAAAVDPYAEARAILAGAAAPPEKPGLVSSSLKKGFATTGQAVGGLTKFLGAEDVGQTAVDYWKNKSQEYEKARPTTQFKDVNGVGDAGKYIAEQTLQMAPLALTAIPAAYGGAALGALAGLGSAGVAASGLAGASLGSIGTEAGIISADVEPGKMDRTQILKGAVPAGLLETVPEMVGLHATGLGKKAVGYVGKQFGRDLVEKEAGDIVKQGLGTRIAKGLGGTALTGLSEGMTESAQSPLEAWGAGKPVFNNGKAYGDDLLKNTAGALTGGMFGGENYTPEMQADMFESMMAGAAGGIGMAGAGHALNAGLNHFVKDDKTHANLTDGSDIDAATKAGLAAGQPSTAMPTESVIPTQQPWTQPLLTNNNQTLFAENESAPQNDISPEQRIADDGATLFQRIDSTAKGVKGIIKAYKNLQDTIDNANFVKATDGADVLNQKRYQAAVAQEALNHMEANYGYTVGEITKAISKRVTEAKKATEAQVKNYNEMKGKPEATPTEKFNKSLSPDGSGQLSFIDDTGHFRTSDELEAQRNALTGVQASFDNEKTIKERVEKNTFKEAEAPVEEVKPTAPVEAAAPTIEPVTPAPVSTEAPAKPKKKISLATGKVTMAENKAAEILEEAEIPVERKTIGRQEGYVKESQAKGALHFLKDKKETSEVVKGEDGRFYVKERIGDDSAPVEHSDKAISDVIDTINKLTGGKASIEFVEGNIVRKDKAGNKVTIKGETVGHIVRLVQSAKDIKEVARHEVIHALKNMGLFTDGEWSILQAKANTWIKQFKINERYSHLDKEGKIEEAIAHAFESPSVKNDTLLDRIKNAIERIWNAVKGNGFSSTKDVFAKVESGEVGNRGWDGGIRDSFSRPALATKTFKDQLRNIARAIIGVKKTPVSTTEKIPSIDGKVTISFNQAKDSSFPHFVSMFEGDYTTEAKNNLIKALGEGKFVPLIKDEANNRAFKAIAAYDEAFKSFVDMVKEFDPEDEIEAPIRIKGTGIVIKNVADLRGYSKKLSAARFYTEKAFKDGDFNAYLSALDKIENLGFIGNVFYNRQAIIKAFMFKHLGSVSEVMLPEWAIFTDPLMYKNREAHLKAYKEHADFVLGKSGDNSTFSKRSVLSHVQDNKLINAVVDRIAQVKSNDILSLDNVRKKDRNYVSMYALRILQDLKAVTFSEPYGAPMEKLSMSKAKRQSTAGGTISFSELKQDSRDIQREASLRERLEKFSELDSIGEEISEDSDFDSKLELLKDTNYNEESEYDDRQAVAESMLSEDIPEIETGGRKADTKGHTMGVQESMRTMGIDPTGTKDKYTLVIENDALQKIRTSGKRKLTSPLLRARFSKITNEYNQTGDAQEYIRAYVELLARNYAYEVGVDAEKVSEKLAARIAKMDEHFETEGSEDLQELSKAFKKQLTEDEKIFPGIEKEAVLDEEGNVSTEYLDLNFVRYAQTYGSRRHVNGKLAPVSHSFGLNWMTRKLYLDYMSSRNKGEGTNRTDLLEKAAQAGALHMGLFGIWPVNMPQASYLKQIEQYITDTSDAPKKLSGTETIITDELREKLKDVIRFNLQEEGGREWRKLTGDISENEKKEVKKAILMPSTDVAGKLSRILSIATRNVVTRRDTTEIKKVDGVYKAVPSVSVESIPASRIPAIRILEKFMARLDKGFASYESDENAIEKFKKYIETALETGTWHKPTITKLLSAIHAPDLKLGLVPLANDKLYTPIANLNLGSIYKDYAKLTDEQKQYITTNIVPIMLKEVENMVGYPVQGHVDATGRNTKLYLYLSEEGVTLSKAERAAQLKQEQAFRTAVNEMPEASVASMQRTIFGLDSIGPDELYNELISRISDVKSGDINKTIPPNERRASLRRLALDNVSRELENLKADTNYGTAEKPEDIRSFIIRKLSNLADTEDAAEQRDIYKRLLKPFTKPSTPGEKSTPATRAEKKRQVLERLADMYTEEAGPEQDYETIEIGEHWLDASGRKRKVNKYDVQRLTNQAQRLIDFIQEAIKDQFTKSEIAEQPERIVGEFVTLMYSQIGGYPEWNYTYTSEAVDQKEMPFVDDRDRNRLIAVHAPLNEAGLYNIYDDRFDERIKNMHKKAQERAMADVEFDNKIKQTALDLISAESKYLNSDDKFYKNIITGEVVKVTLSTARIGGKPAVRYSEAKSLYAVPRLKLVTDFEKEFKPIKLRPEVRETELGPDYKIGSLTEVLQTQEIGSALEEVPKKVGEIIHQYFFDTAEKIPATIKANIDGINKITTEMKEAGKSEADIDTRKKALMGDLFKSVTAISFDSESLTKLFNNQVANIGEALSKLSSSEMTPAEMAQYNAEKRIKAVYKNPIVAEEIAHVLQTLTDAGFLTTSVPTGMKEISKSGRTPYGNKYMLTKKFINYIITDMENKKTAEETQASIAKTDALSAMVDEKGTPTFKDAFRELKKRVPVGTKEWEIFKKYMRNIFEVPYYVARRVQEFMPMMTTSMKRMEMVDRAKTVFREAVDTHLQKMTELKQTNKTEFNKFTELANYADALGDDFNMKKAQELIGFSDKTKELFEDFHKTLRKEMPYRLARLGSTAYMAKFQGIFKIENLHQLAYTNIGEKLGTLSDSEVRAIAKKIMPAEIAESPKWGPKFISHMVGYNDWLKSTQANIASVSNWMPRMRKVREYYARINSVDASGKKRLVGFKYFDTREEAVAWSDKALAKDTDIFKYKVPTDKLEAQIEATAANTLSLYSTMDSRAEYDELQKAMDEDSVLGNNPAFGNATLEEGEAGGKNLSRRIENLVVGYDTEDAHANYDTAFQRMAMSFARLEYGLTQFGNLEAIKMETKAKPHLEKHINDFREHLKHDLKRSTEGDKLASELKQVTALWFMGFRIVSSLVNALQPFISGSPEMAKMRMDAYGGSFVGHQATAVKELAKWIGVSARDVVKNVLPHDKSMVGKLLYKAIPESFGNATHEMPANYKAALDKFHRTGLMHGMFNDFTFSGEMDDNTNRDDIVRDRLRAVTTNSLKIFQVTEIINREGSFLAAFDHYMTIADAKLSQAEKEAYAYTKAEQFVYNSQYMVNKFNTPVAFKKLGPVGTAAYSLMSFPFNMLNQLYHHTLNGFNPGDKGSFKVVMGILGVIFMLGGSDALPFKDFVEFVYRHLATHFGIKNVTGDFNADSQRLLNTLNMPTILNDIFKHGLPAVAGLSISGNLGMQTPLLGGMLSDKNPIESVSGASGALIKNFYTGTQELFRGEVWKGLEHLSPEFIASVSRSTRMYQEGQKTRAGAPVYFKGKPVKEDLGQAMLTGIGLKPLDWADLQQDRQSERSLKQRWEERKKQALASGEPKEFTKFNMALFKANIQGLVKPIQGKATWKPNKGATLYEMQEGNKRIGE